MSLRSRPPIVTIMGHVDHGKTSILDRIRVTKLQAREAGGITQSIGAYQVEWKGSPITFIDTPGHAAFTRMRARGGKVADIAVLVVAADDGVMPQTEEAYSHIQASNASVIVALNKVDIPGVSTAKAKGQLNKLGIEIEEYGGTVPLVETSATTGQGIDTLLDTILKTSESLDLTVEKTEGTATVIESYLDARRGPVITAIVMSGVFTVRDSFVVGQASGRIKALQDWRGEAIKEAQPGTPIEILGADEVPESGATINLVKDIKKAQTDADIYKLEHETRETISAADRVRQALFGGEKVELPLIVKADSQGSLEAVVDSILAIKNGKVSFRILHKGVGTVTESDVLLAVPVKGLVIGFNTAIEKTAQEIARRERVIARIYDVIYRLLEELEDVAQGEVDAMMIDVLGKAKVRKVFELSDGSIVAGSIVTEGELRKGNRVQIIRDDKVVAEGNISSLKKLKDDVGKVVEKDECGIMVNKGLELPLLENDIIQAISV